MSKELKLDTFKIRIALITKESKRMFVKIDDYYNFAMFGFDIIKQTNKDPVDFTAILI